MELVQATKALGNVPVPPKYASKDFKSATCWSLRGKLDVPKERWVSFPGAEREGDSGLVIAWAGWNHLQQAQALAAYLEDLKSSGATESKQLLLLAALSQLIPWLRQWHNDLDPSLGVRLGDYLLSYQEDELKRWVERRQSTFGCLGTDRRRWVIVTKKTLRSVFSRGICL